MSTDFDSERLTSLRAQLNRSLSSLVQGTAVTTPRGGNRPGASRPLGVTPADTTAMAPVGAGRSPNVVSVSVELKGGVIFMDDERQLRALAKEIKRLISEDNRRGLGVG